MTQEAAQVQKVGGMLSWFPVPEGQEEYVRKNPEDWVRQQIALLSNHFRVTVDFMLSTEQRIAAGHYDRVDESEGSSEEEDSVKLAEYDFSLNIVDWKEFPRRISQLIHWECVLLSLQDLGLTDDANVGIIFDRIVQMGLRPATICELLAFGAQFPKVQRRNSRIVAIGSHWYSYKRTVSPVITIEEDNLRTFGEVGLFYGFVPGHYYNFSKDDYFLASKDSEYG